MQPVEDNQLVETGYNQAEQGSLVAVDNRDIRQIVEDSLVQAVLEILAESVESQVVEDIQDNLGLLHIADIQDTSQIHVLQTINHKVPVLFSSTV